MSSVGIGTADFFCNIYRFFCWIHRFFVSSTDEPVKSTDMSVRIADFKKKEKSVIPYSKLWSIIQFKILEYYWKSNN